MPVYNLPDAAYLPGGISILKTATFAEAKKEYSRLRKIALKRLKRFEGTKYEKSAVYKYNINAFPFTKDIKSESEIGSRLAHLKNFLESRQTSLRGLKAIERDTLRTLREHGYKGITSNNLEAFGRFMESARMKAGGKLYSSDAVAELFTDAIKQKVDPEKILKSFDTFLEKENEFRKKKPVTGDSWRKVIENVRADRLSIERRRKR